MTEEKHEYELGDNHEWRKLVDFQLGDKIHVWGIDYPVMFVAYPIKRGDRMRILYLEGEVGQSTDLKEVLDLPEKEFIARKRDR